jgi:universal stress protein F
MMIQRILVGLDSTPRARFVLDAAADIAERFGACLFLLRVIEVPPVFPAAAAGCPRDELPAHLTRLALEDLAAIARRRPSTMIDAWLVRVGVPWRAILACSAEVDADLVVIGSHGYKGLDYVFGTTEEKVVDHCAPSVYLVHGDAVSAEARGA